MNIFPILQYLISGLGVGALISMVGVGGGSIMTPILIFVFSLQTIQAVTIDLIYAFFTKSAAIFFHHKNGNFEHKIFRYVGGSGVIGAVLGSYLISHFHNISSQDVNRIIKISIGILLLISAFINIWFLIFNNPKHKLHISILNNKYGMMFSGLVVGILVAMTSVGAGAIIMVLLLQIWHIPIKKAVSTDLAVGLLIIGAASAAHLFIKFPDFKILIPLIVGGVCGAYLGEKLHGKFKPQFLKKVITFIIAVVGLGMIF